MQVGVLVILPELVCTECNRLQWAREWSVEYNPSFENEGLYIYKESLCLLYKALLMGIVTILNQ